MSLSYNFSAGPAMLSPQVLQKIKEDSFSFENEMISIFETSHRSDAFLKKIDEIELQLRSLLEINDNYDVLFFHGGARGQFSAIPMNFLHFSDKALYLHSGLWSVSASKEAKKYAHIDTINISGQQGIDIAQLQDLDIKEYRYLHYCLNETVDGVAILDDIALDMPKIVDISSCILGQKIDVSRYDLLYAGTQKNLSTAGLAIVIVKKNFFDTYYTHRDDIPSILDYQINIKNRSLYNTPSVFPWYLIGLVCSWIVEEGGASHFYRLNKHKAKMLYDYIDHSDFYYNNIPQHCRSIMNVVFYVKEKELEKSFIIEAEKRGLFYLKGHRAVGGFRASLYNAMPLEGVKALIDFMDFFVKNIK